MAGKNINLRWDGKHVKFCAPMRPDFRSRNTVLTPANYRAEIAKWDDFKQNPAATWVALLFGYDAITHCRLQAGRWILLTPKPGKKGMDSTKLKEGVSMVVVVLKEKSDYTVNLTDGTKTIASSGPTAQRPRSSETWGDRLARWLDEIL